MTGDWTLGGGLQANLGRMQNDVLDVAASAGAGKAQQAVAQAAAMAVQDATDALRNMTTVSTVAVGTILSQLVETGDPKHVDALEKAQRVASEAAKNYALVGRNAALVLRHFDHADEIVDDA